MTEKPVPLTIRAVTPATPPPARHLAAVPEDPADSATITKTATLWISFPVVCAVTLIVVLVAVFR